MFLCAPTGKIGAQTSASTHFLAKKVSALGSSLPIGDDMKVSRQRCERQKCERHQCEARSANANSANETTVRMRQKCEGQVCEGQECECDFTCSANGQNSEVIQIVRSRSLCLPSGWFGLKKKKKKKTLYLSVQVQSAKLFLSLSLFLSRVS